MSTKRNNPETIAIHGGDYRSDPSTNAVAVPIYRTTSYQFDSTEHAANLFALKEFGNIYTRIMNPTNDVLEKRVAALDGGLACLTVSSGQTASTFSILNVAQAGDNIVSSTDLYGGTVSLFTHTLSKLGIEVRYADPSDPKNFEKVIDEKTRAFYGETLPNPYLRVFPIKEVADIGKKYNIPLIVDNTAAPVICKPLEHGAAVVVGRLATVISKIIRGKNKTTYTPHMDHGDFVVVKNIEQAKFTGKKFQDKIYYRHTGHPGGIKETTPEKLHEKKPGETLKLAVKRMLPGGVLGRKQLTKLKIYSGSDHPHAAQNPQVIELGKLNSKNLARN